MGKWKGGVKVAAQNNYVNKHAKKWPLGLHVHLQNKNQMKYLSPCSLRGLTTDEENL